MWLSAPKAHTCLACDTQQNRSCSPPKPVASPASVYHVSPSPTACHTFWKEGRLLSVPGPPHLEHCLSVPCSSPAVPFLSCSFSNQPSLATLSNALFPLVLLFTAPWCPHTTSHPQNMASEHWLTFLPSPHVSTIALLPPNRPAATSLSSTSTMYPAQTRQLGIFVSYYKSVTEIKDAVRT